MNFKIRRFETIDAKEIVRICRSNTLEVNTKDYPLDAMIKLAETFTEKSTIELAEYGHTYVITLEGKVVATGTIHSYWNSEDESIIRRIYTDQKYHGLGFGRKIIETLEKDEFFTRAKRIEIPASITALDFYRKLGYNFKDGKNKVDDEGHYRLEKFNKLIKNKSK